MARPIKIRCCVFNKVLLVSDMCDILYCSYVWGTIFGSYAQNHDFYFHLRYTVYVTAATTCCDDYGNVYVTAATPCCDDYGNA